MAGKEGRSFSGLFVFLVLFLLGAAGLVYAVQITSINSANVNLISPANKTWTTDTTPLFSFNATSTLGITFNCSVTVNGTGVGRNTSVTNDGISTLNSNLTLTQGPNNWNVTCTDDNGGNNVTSAATNLLNIDNIAPGVWLSTPNTTTNETYQNNRGSLLVRFVYNDASANYSLITVTNSTATIGTLTVFLYNDTGTNGITNASGYVSMSTAADSGERNYTVNVTVFDNSSNSNSSSIANALVLDFLAPAVSIDIPTSTAPRGNNTGKPALISFTYNETYTDKITVSIQNATTTVNETIITDGLTNGTNINRNVTLIIPTSGVVEGRYNVTVSILDRASNNGTTVANRALSVDNTNMSIQLNGTLHGPANDTNFSVVGTGSNQIIWNWTAVDNFDTNMSCTRTLNHVNGSDSSSLSTTVANASVGTVTSGTGLVDGFYLWNVTCTDDAGNENTSVTQAVRIDRTAPNVTSTALTTPINNINVSTNTTVLNVTANDVTLRIDTVLFEISNTTPAGSSQPFNVTAARDGTTNFYNVTQNWSNVNEGIQTLTALANDTVNNFNNSVSVTVYVDRSGPNVAYQGLTAANGANISGNLVVNVTSTDNLTAVRNIVISTNLSLHNVSCTSSPCNLTFNTSSVSDGSYKFNATANDTLGNVNTSLAVRTVTVDNTPPAAVNFTSPTPANATQKKGTQTLNATATDATSGIANLTISVGSTRLIVCTNGSAPCNVSWPTANGTFSDGDYVVNVTVTDRAGNQNSTARTITVDNAAPTLTFECTPASVSAGAAVTCTCTGAATVSGFDTNPSTATVGTHTVTCTGTDAAGNSATKDTTYTVTSSTGAGPSGGSGGGISSKDGVFKKTWASVLAGEAATLETKDPSYGIHKIEFKVAETIYGVTVEVKAANEATLPSKYGKKVNKYIEIATKNVKGVTDATISHKVLKSWLASNNLNKEDIVLVRFVAGAGWQQLDTLVEKEDDTYVYYAAKTPGFSFFAIAEAEKPAAPEAPAEAAPAAPEAAPEAPIAGETVTEEVAAEEEAPAAGKEVSPTVWVWAAAGVGALVIVGYALYSSKRKKKKGFA